MNVVIIMRFVSNVVLKESFLPIIICHMDRLHKNSGTLCTFTIGAAWFQILLQSTNGNR